MCEACRNVMLEYNGQHKLPWADLQLKSNLHKYSNKSHINLCERDKEGRRGR